MSLLREVLEGVPVIPNGGWNVGHLANLGMLLSSDEFTLRLDDTNLDILFDIAESGDAGEIRDHLGRIIEIVPTQDSIILMPRNERDRRIRGSVDPFSTVGALQTDRGLETGRARTFAVDYPDAGTR